MSKHWRLTRTDTPLVISMVCHYWDSANEENSLRRAAGRGLDPWPHILLVKTPADSDGTRPFVYELCHGSSPWAPTSPHVPPRIKWTTLLFLIHCINTTHREALCVTHHEPTGGIQVAGFINRSLLSFGSLCCLLFISHSSLWSSENWGSLKESVWKSRCASRSEGLVLVFPKSNPQKSSAQKLWLMTNCV